MNTTDKTALFEAQRPRLLALSYHMLGERHAAEDIVQEAWVKWDAAELDKLHNAEGWLSTVVTRLALDQLRSARHRRELYVGPWLPEPLLSDPLSESDGPQDALELARRCELAMLWSLEKLNEVERAVFILGDVFELPYSDIAEKLQRSEASVRQTASRARKRMRSDERCFEASAEQLERAILQFSEAATAGRKEDVLKMLAPDVVALSDGGGVVSAARIPLMGAEKVAQVVTHISQKQGELSGIELVRANGRPALLRLQGDEQDMLFTLRLDSSGKIDWIYILRNPEKLATLKRRE